MHLREAFKSRSNDLLGSSLNWTLLTSEASQRPPSPHPYSPGTPVQWCLLRHCESPSLFQDSWPSTVISKYFGHGLLFFFICFQYISLSDCKIYENRTTLTHLTLFPKCLARCLVHFSHESNTCSVNFDDDRGMMVIQEKLHDSNKGLFSLFS